MKSFLQGFLQAALSGALQGGAAASQVNSGDVKGIGITAGVGSIAGILQYLIQHPITSQAAPVVQTVIVTKPPAT